MKLGWKPATLVLCICMVLAVQAVPAAAGRSGGLFFAPADNSALAELVTLEEALARAQARLTQVSSDIVRQKNNLRGLEARYAGVQAKADQLRHTIEARMISLYKHRSPSMTEIIISSDDINQVLDLQEYSTRLAMDDVKQIQASLAQMSELGSALLELTTSRDQLAESERQAAAEVDRINRQVAAKKALLASVPDVPSLEQQAGDVRGRVDQINSGQPAPSDLRPGRTMIMKATAYSPQEPGLDDHTASGLPARYGVVAVDPTVIPLGTRLLVEGYGEAIAGDTGSAIKGMRIDLCFDTLAECEAYGVRMVRVTVLE